MSIVTLKLSDIDVSDRLRQVDAAEAGRMALSLASTGQLQPIEVTPTVRAGRYRLVIGGHRVAAAVLLGWDDIQAVVFKGSADQIRLREIDENLYRRELSPFDQAEFLTQRREVCLRLGLLPKHGGDRKSDQGANLALRSYEAELAQKFGLSRRTLFRSMRRRAAICADAWAAIEGTAIAEKGAFLDALIGVPKEAQVTAVNVYLATSQPGGKRVPFAHICRDASGRMPPVTDPAHVRRKALQAAWAATTAEDRAFFVDTMTTPDRRYLVRLLNARGEAA